MAGLRLLALLLFLVGCAGGKLYLAAADQQNTDLLEDCTERIAHHFGWPVFEMSEAERRRAVRAASLWADDTCYAPCKYRMCASVKEVSARTVTIYVSYDVTEHLSEDSETIVIRLGPEAEVVFSRKNYRVRKVLTFHSGCRWLDTDCDYDPWRLSLSSSLALSENESRRVWLARRPKAGTSRARLYP